MNNKRKRSKSNSRVGNTKIRGTSETTVENSPVARNVLNFPNGEFTLNQSDSIFTVENANNSRGIQLRNGKVMSKGNMEIVQPSQICDGNQVTIFEGDEPADLPSTSQVEDDRIITSVDHQEDEEFPAEEEYDSDEEQVAPMKKVKRGIWVGDWPRGRFITLNDDEYNSISSPDPEISFKNKVDQTQPKQFENLRGDPAFETFIKGLVAKEVRNSVGKGDGGVSRKGQQPQRRLFQQKSPLQRVDPSKGTPKGNMVACNNNRIKSPSDTTIYAPALARANTDPSTQILENILNQNLGIPAVDGVIEGPPEQPEIAIMQDNSNVSQNDIVADISKFIEGVRLQSSVSRVTGKDKTDPQPGASGHQTEDELVAENAKRRAGELILQAERYKASVNTPPGNYCEKTDQNQACALDEDQFFHVSCHVDSALRTKIEKGQFVDLERLLPRTRLGANNNEDTEMKLVFREGKSYFVPAQTQSRINTVRKWEQAFRIYAAIYSEANPSRAAEIWQYVHVINVAAGTYYWDNVSSYDITFRHLMSQNPGRSWSKIYNQMWNLSMRHVLPRTGTNQFNSQNNTGFDFNKRQSNSGNNTNNNAKANAGGGGGNVRKPKYCWAHNRGNCKDGNKCPYVNRCSYCDGSEHGKNSCPKIGNK